MDLFQKTMEPVEKVLRDAKMDKASIHEVVGTGLSGGREGIRGQAYVKQIGNQQATRLGVGAVEQGRCIRGENEGAEARQDGQDLHPQGDEYFGLFVNLMNAESWLAAERQVGEGAQRRLALSVAGGVTTTEWYALGLNRRGGQWQVEVG